jgi:hypothetical protein
VAVLELELELELELVLVLVLVLVQQQVEQLRGAQQLPVLPLQVLLLQAQVSQWGRLLQLQPLVL